MQDMTEGTWLALQLVLSGQADLLGIVARSLQVSLSVTSLA
jgi:ABC-type tungstate transport system substrate-binding protein